ncbi:hypothetical protein Hokovirus_2_188 [Hokovirus HKV1]|uniref:Uncharacterized protein n=1 Tax=Hokovirus HKV1 TaxID=1977638 RepID=A0A1V0SG54_9VIRU|nr:hypothetical protein Hokovirus_2_188 [Hokovirus HKV1]
MEQTNKKYLEPSFNTLLEQLNDNKCIDINEFNITSYKLQFIEDNKNDRDRFKTLAIPKYNYGNKKLDYIIFSIQDVKLERPGITNPKYWHNDSGDYKLRMWLDKNNKCNKKMLSNLKCIDNHNSKLFQTNYIPLVKQKQTQDYENLECFTSKFKVSSDGLVQTRVYYTHENDQDNWKEETDVTLEKLYVLLKDKPKVNLVCAYTKLTKMAPEKKNELVFNTVQILAIKIEIPEKKNNILGRVGIINKNNNENTKYEKIILYIVIFILLLVLSIITLLKLF